MTTLISQRRADILRSIGDSALVLIAMWAVDVENPGRFTKAKELLPYLYPSIKDIRKLEAQLNALCASGRLALTSGGYVLVEGGRALALELLTNHKDLALSPVQDAGTSKAQALEIIDAVAKNVSESDARNFRALKKIEEEDGFVSIQDSSSTSDSDAQNARKVEIVPEVVGITFEDGTPIYSMLALDGSLITVRDILAATEVIEDFGDIAHGLPVDAIKPELALAWVAKAYDDRQKLTHPPAALLYSRLKDIEKPSPGMKYWKNPARFLPDEYCVRLKIEKYDCKSCIDAKFSAKEDYDAHVREAHLAAVKQEEFSPSTIFPALDAGSRGARAWDTVKAELQMDMPRASYDTWVRDTQAVALEDDTLTVAVRNAYARDWLESRLQSKVDSMLRTYSQNGIARVEFVVGSVEEMEA